PAPSVLPSRTITSSPPQTPKTRRPGAIPNESVIAATLDRGAVRIDSAHLVGPQTDIAATGIVTFAGTQHMNLSVKANTDIGLLQDFDRDIFASGKVILSAAVGGTFDKPQVNGS